MPAARSPHVAPLFTDDAVLGGRIVLRQPSGGYRAGLDAALLAAACDPKDGQRVLDVGCGVGGALLPAATRNPAAVFVGVEKDGPALALAGHNIEANTLGDRVSALEGDVADGFRSLGQPAFDAAICNPPFFEDAKALRGPAPAKRNAWMADDGLDAWIGYLLKAVREGGTLTLVHRADSLANILRALAPKAGSFQLRFTHPFEDAPAGRVLVRAVKTGKAPLRVLPPLTLHMRGGAKHTAQAEAILRGEARLDWA